MKKLGLKLLGTFVVLLSLIGCDNTPKNQRFGVEWTDGKIQTVDVEYKDNLVLVKETEVLPACYMSTQFPSFYSEGACEPKTVQTKTEIKGTCPKVSVNDWECGGYRMINGELHWGVHTFPKKQ